MRRAIWTPNWEKMRKEAISTILYYCYPDEFQIGFKEWIYKHLNLFRILMNAIWTETVSCYREISVRS